MTDEAPKRKIKWDDGLRDRMAMLGVPVPEKTQASEIEAQGWEHWCRTLFPYLFSRPFTQYQKDFWEWGWAIQPNKYYRPRVECEARGVGKSTNAEALAVSMVARRKRKMVGYVSLNETKATKHFESIKSMLENDNFLKHYPHCKPKPQKLKDVAGQWSRDAIVLASGAMIVPLTLQGSARGWKSSEGARFDLILLDDVDELGQSVEFTQKLIDILKGEILAAGHDTTVVIMPQNLIHRDSICAQVQDHRADILSDRIFCGPFPLLKWYDAEKIDIEGDNTGAKEWVITQGEAFDPAISIEYAQRLLNKFGRRLFDRECQHKIHEIEDDKDFREWSEVHHLVTYSEFKATMEALGEPVWNIYDKRLQVPSRWNVGMGFDNGTTVGHPSAVSIVARPAINCPFSNSYFMIGEIVLPKFPSNSFDKPELVSPGRVARAIKEFQGRWNIADTQIVMKLMSHEASSAQNTMLFDLPDDEKEYFGKWRARKGSGVAQIQNVMEIDHTKEHPFRKYPKGTKLNGEDVSGKSIIGCPRLFFLVDDEQGELRVDPNGSLYVTGAKDCNGFARARFEIPLFSQYNTGAAKINDDFVDCWRGLANSFFVQAGGYTPQEQREQEMAKKNLSWEAIDATTDQSDRDGLITRRLLEDAKQEMNNQAQRTIGYRGKFARR